MVAAGVTLTVKKEAMAPLLPAMIKGAQPSIADEPGCYAFDGCTDPMVAPAVAGKGRRTDGAVAP